MIASKYRNGFPLPSLAFDWTFFLMTRTKLASDWFVAARNCMRQQVAGRSPQRHATLATYYKVLHGLLWKVWTFGIWRAHCWGNSKTTLTTLRPFPPIWGWLFQHPYLPISWLHFWNWRVPPITHTKPKHNQKIQIVRKGCEKPWLREKARSF